MNMNDNNSEATDTGSLPTRHPSTVDEWQSAVDAVLSDSNLCPLVRSGFLELAADLIEETLWQPWARPTALLIACKAREAVDRDLSPLDCLTALAATGAVTFRT